MMSQTKIKTYRLAGYVGMGVYKCICAYHSGKSATIRESNHGSGVCKAHYALYYIYTIKLHFVSRNWRMEN